MSAVGHAVGRADRAREPVVRDGGELRALGDGERRVGPDDADGGVERGRRGRGGEPREQRAPVVRQGRGDGVVRRSGGAADQQRAGAGVDGRARPRSTTVSAVTVSPPAVVAEAVPTPPLSPPTSAPVPAPTTPCADGPSTAAASAAARARRRDGRGSRRRGRGRRPPPRGRSAPPRRARADREADPGVAERVHHPGRGRQPVGRAAGEHHGVHAVDEGAGVERVGLAGPGAAAADVDAGHGTVGARHHHGRAGQGAVADPWACPSRRHLRSPRPRRARRSRRRERPSSP